MSFRGGGRSRGSRGRVGGRGSRGRGGRIQDFGPPEQVVGNINLRFVLIFAVVRSNKYR